MPVLFRGNSEYKTHYKWSPSYRSASFVPKPDQMADDAGLRSDQLSSLREPGFTVKKKVWHRDPQVQSCLVWWPDSCSEDNDTTPRQIEAATNGQVSGMKEKKAAKQSEQPTRVSSNKRHKPRSPISNGSVILTSGGERKTTGKKSPKKQIIETEFSKRKESHSRTPSPTKSSRREENVKTPISSKKLKSNKTPTKIKSEQKKEVEASPKDRLQPNVSNAAKNIPLQRKAGLAGGKPARTSRARLSEYQRNFLAPKYPVKPSPLLSALDVVHSSSSAIPPHSGVRQRPTSTEYIANYKNSSPLSKSLPGSSPASPSMKLKVKDMQNPQRPFFTHAKRKNLKSEYATQFERNQEFQVDEMRKMAEENKQKHEGSHIDPDHATQVVSPYNRCWEVSSQGSSSIKDVEDDDLEIEDDIQPLVVRESEKEKFANRKSQRSLESHNGTEIETDSLDEGQSVATVESGVRKLAWGEEDEEKSERSKENGEKEESQTIYSESTFEGRVATPKLQSFGGARRTHLDLTTPSRGGALLISPSKQTNRNTPGSHFSTPRRTPKQQTTPVAGSPTHDAHKLLESRKHPLVRSSPGKISAIKTFALDRRQNRESPARSSINKETAKDFKDARRQIVRESPPPRQVWTTGNIRAPIKGMLRSEEFQHCGPLGNASPTLHQKPQDDDALSIASSLTSVRASDLLRKAQQRKSFWATK